MRMSPTDLADVPGYAYTYLMNGTTPAGNWTGVLQRGEKVRLRFINGSSMTFFDVRIPGLKLKVIAADGQDVAPVTVDEFRIGNAEVLDVIVELKDDRAYTIFAQSIDRTGYARGTLAPQAGMQAEVPPLDSERGRRLDGASGRRTRELVEERHLAEDVAGSEGGDLLLFAIAVLDDVDLARTDDERADAGVALADDLLPRFVALLDCCVGNRFE